MELTLRPVALTRPASLILGDSRISRRVDGRAITLSLTKAVGAESVPVRTKKDQVSQT